MAFAGLKKQINKANQYVTEKMGGAEGTKLDLDFMDMERKTDVTVELVEELQAKTKEYLQPNPTARAKMAAVKGISKLSGQAKSNTYPQPEGILAECMLTYGKKLGDDSVFANALVEMGDSLKQMADVKYSLDDNIKQNFLEPLHQLQTKDLKEVMHHRKKLQGRRLDFDCKKRRQAKGSQITDDEIRSAEEKFAESLQLAQVGMYNLLENDVEQVSQLVTFADGLLDYHSQCADILRVLVEVLNEKREEAANRPKAEFVPKTLADLNIETLGSQDGMNGGSSSRLNSPVNKPTHLELLGNGQAQARSTNASPLPSPMRSPARTPMPAKPTQPCCTALYDFEPENPGELGFKENDVITLIQRVDENWFEGSVNGRTGYFPQSYVQVTVPFP
ncbi:endophilin-A isoform X1 [Topomyia yanbarensis]|uniref:endophilin-A isoform X1 n=1 Tax=Topomyia yanbarensis TaxID=2498891 RepID=UPI00273CE328|nr:endophilin-A isoform X1 [Topomyia yanbarensis]XP_058832322.1 endophilin-A isoform X1 [Topomyia yanbarensis]XP_058832323.1 endophilin-A isoform X1 [Topomyia yanbarensis]XP_058832324.1 endophilin-A isoform X1 [Topomyia yanbarensis]XP_058832325.1 endophilin-A isoform X1 [Topomyia yanbarensis]XP_058832326.1 endophilin-A isoform X1 [Topomyia yanbarensis]XP_058832327.1 endophilin-A isoform X1 [Topomyia yanbarensis]